MAASSWLNRRCRALIWLCSALGAAEPEPLASAVPTHPVIPSTSPMPAPADTTQNVLPMAARQPWSRPGRASAVLFLDVMSSPAFLGDRGALTAPRRYTYTDESRQRFTLRADFPVALPPLDPGLTGACDGRRSRTTTLAGLASRIAGDAGPQNA